ncbi:heparan sulfate glucosamine 3-O-sulfotransferase 1-like [Patiria miniata]|uniref:Sulfotransferase domain-containing protein n=1 Tax=Patiria miniata TaxID=46514 RepID=A0A913ZKZ9_PATMI|nr:heparan sulfate glucosamine 3-O-sulfotransferase 1-like [Patiria miniata]XP_038051766.1 heparan sulfate glucosamine 3-O-sulfotransferase 1-like [Patiria miniata]XP_038051767.1 heparan sulfate glucosamine 3-O-sulfotransferase 1-like [Patiria miniata]XP_038051768.1 heparan sulfate glucosamine 3-O-sulfotransferase 1-like [Patiria miniata]
MTGDTSPYSRWRKRVILITVVSLLLAFSLGMLEGSGTHPRRKSHIKTWSRPGAGYQLEVDKTIPPNGDNAITHAREDFNCDKCCYRYTTIENGILEIRSKSELQERVCKKRLPDVIIFGMKKCGTTSLKNFLSYHPDIAFTQNELTFFSSSDRTKGVEFYRSEMVYSTPDQISIEKTPDYCHYPQVPRAIKAVLPNVKLIIIMRDPVERAISDFVHMQVSLAKKCKKKSACRLDDPAYYIADTFEDSIIDSNGDLNFSNLLVAKGVYVTYIRRYRKYFKPEQVLALDGETFIKNPYPAVKLVEQFLGIRDYFTRDHFYYDVQKGFFCLNKPIPNNCMKESKGRPHPEVNDETLRKLRDYYRPYNKALNKLMKVDFHWSS